MECRKAEELSLLFQSKYSKLVKLTLYQSCSYGNGKDIQSNVHCLCTRTFFVSLSSIPLILTRRIPTQSSQTLVISITLSSHPYHSMKTKLDPLHELHNKTGDSLWGNHVCDLANQGSPSNKYCWYHYHKPMHFNNFLSEISFDHHEDYTSFNWLMQKLGIRRRITSLSCLKKNLLQMN